MTTAFDKTVVTFRHCGKDIYTFSDQIATLSSLCLQNQACARKHQCPVCQEPLVLGLLDAPVALPCPFTNGHRAPCSFLIGANDGPSFLREGHDTELHVGVSNSKGLVYNYTLSGVQRDEHGWEQCICIQLVPPWRDSLIESWDKELQLFSSLPIWTPERFHEEREFGSCCYGFALTFINYMRSLDSKDSLSRDEFTTSSVLPRMKRASMYIKMYEEIQQHGLYIADK
ncbi:MKRN2 opposite strand, tandem duplicate 1 [Pygocentrus nattereri]|uniref:MKRN2 opposite strand, tandem duplicate 1 n=1 Tax=Pygocentrus nattereri TaxID=42514 RepID=UPI0008146C23|nr:MKRN2 opposite strand, tandem duplicate 1 [Pygocentrus nattereri]XP_017560270.1 MKRN2 opposite strand, tandem duplicate 1 [Pygocentrus nattereri]XP_037388310.1 MKRN2 opposite strand, tandem duplicate 1 [Pygocentrus nattereri]